MRVFIKFFIMYKTVMAGKKKNKRSLWSDVDDTAFVSDEDLQWTGDRKLKNTPFATLKEKLKQAQRQASVLPSSGTGNGTGQVSPCSNRGGQGRAAPAFMAMDRPSSNSVSGSEDAGLIVEPDDDSRLFLKAMDGVRPLSQGSRLVDTALSADVRPVSERLAREEEAACRGELEAIIKGKRQIPVEYTPEYAEGPVINSNPRIVRKLRRGKFSVQGYCDLHGLTAREALEWCEEFMSRSIAANRSCIAFIHGRGLSSPRGPVLKKMVHEWLRTGRWRRYIVAYSSAPSWDGGPGVTYVLLRQRPAPRKRRKKPRLWST